MSRSSHAEALSDNLRPTIVSTVRGRSSRVHGMRASADTVVLHRLCIANPHYLYTFTRRTPPWSPVQMEE